MQNAIDLLLLAKDIASIVGGGQLDLNMLAAAGDPSYDEMGKKHDISDAAMRFLEHASIAAGTGLSNWAFGFVKSQRSNNVLLSADIYLPNPLKGTGSYVPLTTPIKLRFGKKQVPLVLILGAPADAYGQFLGYGLTVGNAKAGASRKQLFRMDHHTWHKDRGKCGVKTNNEIDAYCDRQNPNYHYHIMKWTGGK